MRRGREDSRATVQAAVDHRRRAGCRGNLVQPQGGRDAADLLDRGILVALFAAGRGGGDKLLELCHQARDVEIVGGLHVAVRDGLETIGELLVGGELLGGRLFDDGLGRLVTDAEEEHVVDVAHRHLGPVVQANGAVAHLADRRFGDRELAFGRGQDGVEMAGEGVPVVAQIDQQHG